jgi:hypothetical protein
MQTLRLALEECRRPHALRVRGARLRRQAFCGFPSDPPAILRLSLALLAQTGPLDRQRQSSTITPVVVIMPIVG